jgi:hypothetical protein
VRWLMVAAVRWVRVRGAASSPFLFPLTSIGV